jgi:hypothetical protein
MAAGFAIPNMASAAMVVAQTQVRSVLHHVTEVVAGRRAIIRPAIITSFTHNDKEAI